MDDIQSCSKAPVGGSYHLRSHFVTILNIPKHWHSRDLRIFFKHAVENGRFVCFHFKHRPCVVTQSATGVPSVSESEKPDTYCAFAAFACEKHRELFITDYNGIKWIADAGNQAATAQSVCVVKPVTLSKEDLKTMPELSPPTVMPRGNVGTPSQMFLQLTQDCSLPSSVIKSLGLKFVKKLGKYAAVPPPGFSPNSEDKTFDESDFRDTVPVSSNHVETGNVDGSRENFDNEEEDWDRHIDLHDDVRRWEERTKPRLYEKEEELVWEKGGPGIVWYTDDAFWQQVEGTEEADDWDVDMQVHEGRGGYQAADMDARDCHDMLRSEELREGTVRGTVFAKKVMERQGWKQGGGLGGRGHGETVAVADKLTARHPTNKAGLGYKGEKLQRFGLKRRLPEHTIKTVYDRDTEP